LVNCILCNKSNCPAAHWGNGQSTSATMFADLESCLEVSAKLDCPRKLEKITASSITKGIITSNYGT
jgi:hypothetical protein